MCINDKYINIMKRINNKDSNTILDSFYLFLFISIYLFKFYFYLFIYFHIL